MHLILHKVKRFKSLSKLKPQRVSRFKFCTYWVWTSVTVTSLILGYLRFREEVKKIFLQILKLSVLPCFGPQMFMFYCNRLKWIHYKWYRSKTFLNELGDLISDVTNLSSLFLGVVFRHIPRDANMAAHELAIYALRSEEDVVWLENIPPPIVFVVLSDISLINNRYLLYIKKKKRFLQKNKNKNK